MLHIPLIAMLLTQAGTEEKPRLVVLDLQAAGGVDLEVAEALSEALTTRVAQSGFFEVTSAQDVQTLLTVERQKQLLGCGEDATSCFTELAGALGARFVLRGTVAKIGESHQLTLQMLDSEKGQAVGRATRIAPSLDDLRAMLPWAIADATGTPPPPRPSNAGAYSLVLAGALAMGAGGVVGYGALAQEQRIATELEVGKTTPGVLKTADVYRAEASRIQTEKRISVGALGAGALLIAVGALLYESDAEASGNPGLSLVPTHQGMALVGVFP